jgi:predicted ATPase
MGYPDQALVSARRGIAYANDLGHAPSVAHALWLAGFVLMMRRDARLVLETSERLETLVREHDSAVYRVAARVLRGWARTLLDESKEEGLVEMREAVGAYQSLTGVMAGPFLVSLADSERRLGHFDMAAATLEQAEAVVNRRGEQLWVGGVLRSRGDLAASRPTTDLAAAEHFYTQAMAIARSVGAKSAELRAAKGLARLWRQQGKVREARVLLAPLLGWCAGFDRGEGAAGRDRTSSEFLGEPDILERKSGNDLSMDQNRSFPR